MTIRKLKDQFEQQQEKLKQQENKTSQRFTMARQYSTEMKLVAQAKTKIESIADQTTIVNSTATTTVIKSRESSSGSSSGKSSPKNLIEKSTVAPQLLRFFGKSGENEVSALSRRSLKLVRNFSEIPIGMDQQIDSKFTRIVAKLRRDEKTGVDESFETLFRRISQESLGMI